MANPDEPLLELEGVHVAYSGAEALRGIDLIVGQNEIIALVGANGAGKTTTLRCISGLIRPTRGAIRFRRQELVGREPDQIARLGIAHVPEGRRLFDRMTVRENLEMGLFRRWPVRPEHLEEALVLFPEIRPLLGRQAYSLSGGEQQMVAVARALLPGPSLVLLDEPSLGLAPIVVGRILEAIVGLRSNRKSVLLVEQNTAVALSCCDRGYVLENGRVALSGTNSELAANPELTDVYFGGHVGHT